MGGRCRASARQLRRSAKSSRQGISSAEWQARVDLAAVYRLIAHYGWDDVIYNHSSMRVPASRACFSMKRHELLYTEVTASNLVKVSMDGDIDEKAGVNRPGFTLHGGVLSARPDVNCAVHVHTNNGMAIAGLKPACAWCRSSGYRINDFAYITDAKYIPESEKKKLKGCKIIVVNALRRKTHISHFTLEEAVELLKELKPEQAYLTHISHQLGLHEEVEKELPAFIRLAYDAFSFEV